MDITISTIYFITGSVFFICYFIIDIFKVDIEINNKFTILLFGMFFYIMDLLYRILALVE